MKQIEAEAEARGHRGQRIQDFVQNWINNPKAGTGRRAVKFRKKKRAKGRVNLDAAPPVPTPAERRGIMEVIRAAMKKESKP